MRNPFRRHTRSNGLQTVTPQGPRLSAGPGTRGKEPGTRKDLHEAWARGRGHTGKPVRKSTGPETTSISDPQPADPDKPSPLAVKTLRAC